MSDELDRDPATGLPGYQEALSGLMRLQHDIQASECYGLVILSFPPNAALLRLSPEDQDILRRGISWQLIGSLREQDQLYSLGTWEWLAVLPCLPSPASVMLAVLKIQRVFHQHPLEVQGYDLGLQMSCGSVIFPDHGNDPRHLIQSARIALLYANQKNEYSAMYHPRMDKTELHHVDLAYQLQEALREDRLQLFLQPQVDLHTWQCNHAELLLRWQQPDGEWCSPTVALKVLEQAGLRLNFNRWLLQHTALYLAKLHETRKNFHLSVNLFASDLQDMELPDLVAQALSTWKVPPNCLTLEITETAAVRESKETNAVMRHLCDMNVRLAIDDFGTGYSGMSYLQHMPVHEIKIDQRFILPLAESPRDRDIVRSITELAHKLNMEIVAEGTETPTVLEYLKQMNCQRVQGYFFSEALPMGDFLRWLDNRKYNSPL